MYLVKYRRWPTMAKPELSYFDVVCRKHQESAFELARILDPRVVEVEVYEQVLSQGKCKWQLVPETEWEEVWKREGVNKAGIGQGGGDNEAAISFV